ncbi:roadblock/LC7 domain-containing protein [Fodinicola feengrottensis]|uniref:Roadblock/LC7 domain-containing protein n=1 Tax=Fodinicola feengrottensis TaxID=435914 RepID=A0ABP4VA69_9ACTN|nr:roadblock/LC7 domain-containing protein [Fodinicola feengrottensis]
MTGSDSPIAQFGWLVTTFTERVPGAAHAVVVSTDGLLLTASARLPQDRADQLAAAAAGLLSLAQGAARCFDAGGVRETVVQMDRGLLMLMAIGEGSCLAVLATPNCDIGQVAYEMALLVEQVGQILTPRLRAELQGTSYLPTEPVSPTRA